MRLSSQQIQPVFELYQAGLYLRAYALADGIAPLHTWLGAEARVLAGRLAANRGGGKLARVLHRLAYREDPAHPDVLYYSAKALLDRRGPLDAWNFLCRHGDLPDAPPECRANWFSLYAQVAGFFRDFEVSEQWLRRAESLAPQDPWLQVEWAGLLERQDCYDGALDAARRSLELRPWYRPGVQSLAHVLQLLGRDAEALDLLREAAHRMESAAVVYQLGALQTELQLYEAARDSYARFVELSPLLDRKSRRVVSAVQSDAAYYCGDWESAAELASQSANPFHLKVAESLRQTRGRGKRVILPVGFVRQHHMTCAPATLSTLSRFWSAPADHLALAETICYDGTPAHSERRWAEEHGWIAREFRVDWDGTAELINRGIPFTFTTTEPTGGHLQAIIGYDELRGTFVVRDPYTRNFVEFVGNLVLERYRSTGPRGMLMVPQDRGELLDGLSLPEQDLYDHIHALQAALDRHDRGAAAAALARMESADADHRLTLWARLTLAGYDGDTPGLLACYERLLELFPDDSALLLGKLGCLRVVGRREDRLALLDRAYNAKGTNPVLWQQYAQELQDDARRSGVVEWLLRRSVRFQPGVAAVYHAMGNAMWRRRRFESSLQLYRIACCLDDKDETFARAYFVASRHFKQHGAVLDMLRDRFRRFGRRSARPARLLFWAYEELNREQEGFQLIDEAVLLRPDDGDLRLLAADASARHGRLADADRHLEAARGRSSDREWHRVGADVALYRGEPRQALSLWTRIVESEPLAIDAHRRVAQLLAQTEGPAATIAHLDRACERFPHNLPLLQLRIGWLRDDFPEQYQAAVDQLVRQHPTDGWARREMVSVLIDRRRFDEAVAEAEVALQLEPHSPASYGFRGLAAAGRGDWPAAREAYREAIRLSVDYDFAIRRLLAACETSEMRAEALAFVHTELVRQTTFGDGLLAYRAEAQGVLQPDQLLALLKEALGARPDLWHAWSAVTQQLLCMGRFDEARENATDAAQRFPLLPRLWLDLARVYRATSDRDAEAAALREALAISPGWDIAARELAQLHERDGDFEKSRAVLTQTMARDPFDAVTLGMLADMLWKLGDRDKAIEHVQRAVQLDPGYDWGWNTLKQWGRDQGRPGLAVELARDLTVRRAGEARSWLILARVLDGPADLEEQLRALDRAVELNPRAAEAYDSRAQLLAAAGRFDEALAACRPSAWGEHIPVELRGRAAWIEAQRKNHHRAIEQFRALVEESPRYYWGWLELANCYRAVDDSAQYRWVAASMVGLWPLDARSLGMLGSAKLWTGDPSGAKEALRSAIARDPSYGYAPAKLFELELEDRNVAAAAEALTHLRRHAPGPRTVLYGVRLAAQRADRSGALREFRSLCRDATAEQWMLEQAMAALSASRWEAEMELAMVKSLRSKKRGPAVVPLLIHRLLTQKRSSAVPRLIRLLQRRHEAAARDIAAEYLRQIARRQQRGRLRFFLIRQRKWLRSDSRLWGTAGAALHATRYDRAAIRWMNDWETREGVEAWMLVSLAEAFRARGDSRRGGVVNRYAVNVLKESEAHSVHRLWLAADAALAGNVPRVDELLGQVDTRAMAKRHLFVRDMINAVISGSRDGRAGFKLWRQQIREAVSRYSEFRRIRELRRFYRASLRALSRRPIGLAARCWCWHHLIGS